MKKFVRSLVPAPLLSAYHFLLALLAALIYRFPSRKLIVIGVTGTNGKSSTTEYINAIFEAAGHRTALSNSIRTKIRSTSEPSLGRSMPGRFFLQRLMRRALEEKCTVAIIEMTSEGARQHRHRFIALDALVFTNLAPEHIEAHGSLAAYADAKFKLGLALQGSHKRPRVMVANADDVQGPRYLSLNVEKKIGTSLRTLSYESNEHGGSFDFNGENIRVALPGTFYIQNSLQAAALTTAFDVPLETIKRGIESVTAIPGRMQEIKAGQPFSVIVDYALTPDALEVLYKTYANKKKICVFGSAGGGRDHWKRPVLGRIADRYCEEVILTNDIAYDESPQHIIEEIAAGMKKTPTILLDRREAIRTALERAVQTGPECVVLITGMGIDSEITSAQGKKIPWSDVGVAKEELKRLQV